MMNVSSGAAAGGPLIGKYERPLRCPMDNGKCSFLPDLCFQEVKSYDPNGAPNGSVKESCYVCVPSFNVKAPDGTVEYRYYVDIESYLYACGLVRTCARVLLCACVRHEFLIP
jgi:hypothetical protein